MSFITHTRDGQRQPVATPSLLAACIAMALMPTVSFAASTTEDTVVVEGGFDNAQDPSSGQDQDYSVKTTTTGTKLLLVPRDIPQSVSVISQQRMADQNLQSVGQVLTNTTGVTARYRTATAPYFTRADSSSVTMRSMTCRPPSAKYGTLVTPPPTPPFMTV